VTAGETGIRGQHRRELVLPFLVVHGLPIPPSSERAGGLDRPDRIWRAERNSTVR